MQLISLLSIFALTSSALAYSGDFTWYNIEAGQTACGWRNKGNEHLVAINQQQWNERPSKWSNDGQTNTGNQCGRAINIQYNGKKIRAVVADLCPECAYGSLDLTQGLFRDLIGDLGKGRVKGTWQWA
jgi:hypothetical protein